MGFLFDENTNVSTHPKRTQNWAAFPCLIFILDLISSGSTLHLSAPKNIKGLLSIQFESNAVSKIVTNIGNMCTLFNNLRTISEVMYEDLYTLLGQVIFTDWYNKKGKITAGTDVELYLCGLP